MRVERIKQPVISAIRIIGQLNLLFAFQTVVNFPFVERGGVIVNGAEPIQRGRIFTNTL